MEICFETDREEMGKPRFGGRKRKDVKKHDRSGIDIREKHLRASICYGPCMLPGNISG